jgi:hypothetical protein
MTPDSRILEVPMTVRLCNWLQNQFYYDAGHSRNPTLREVVGKLSGMTIGDVFDSGNFGRVSYDDLQRVLTAAGGPTLRDLKPGPCRSKAIKALPALGARPTQ